jgi:hypothetical protein
MVGRSHSQLIKVHALPVMGRGAWMELSEARVLVD